MTQKTLCNHKNKRVLRGQTCGSCRNKQRRETDSDYAARVKAYYSKWNIENYKGSVRGSEKSKRYRASLNDPQRAEQKAARLKWHRENPDSRRAAYRRWSKRNPDKIRNKDAKRRAVEMNAFDEHVDRYAVYTRYNGLCGICDKRVDRFNFHLDHIIPLSKGGRHNYDNTQPAHPKCNLQKGNRIPV